MEERPFQGRVKDLSKGLLALVEGCDTLREPGPVFIIPKTPRLKPLYLTAPARPQRGALPLSRSAPTVICASSLRSPGAGAAPGSVLGMPDEKFCQQRHRPPGG